MEKIINEKLLMSHPEDVRDPHPQESALSDSILGGQDGWVNVLGVVLGIAAQPEIRTSYRWLDWQPYLLSQFRWVLWRTLPRWQMPIFMRASANANAGISVKCRTWSVTK